MKVIEIPHGLTTGTREPCNRLSIPKPLKKKKVRLKIAPHVQQNDEP
jgi:hypothetical protein